MAKRGLVLLKLSGVGGEGVICVLLDGVVWMLKKKYTLADERRRKKLHAKRIFFMMKELKDCTRRARFKICALATACTGLVEIQTLRSVYETKI